MFVRVDKGEGTLIEGFCYANADGHEEKVVLDSGVVIIEVVGYEAIPVYTQDIPNLVKALQAAYDHIKEIK